MTTATELTLQRDGLTLSATLHGPAQGPLVLLVHGFPDTPHCWDKVVPRLTSAGYRVLVPWLRGYTLASVDRNANYGLVAAAGDLDAWRKHVGATCAHLAGHDWGAALTMTLVGQQPEYWISGSLLAVPPLPDFPYFLPALIALPKQLWMSSYMLLMQSAWAGNILSRNRAAFVATIWRRWSPGWRFTEEEFAPTRKAFSQPDIAWAATRYYRALFSPLRAESRRGWHYMSRTLAVPTLALAGQEDGCMNIRLHQKLTSAEEFPAGLVAKRLPGCGHFLQAEQPHAVARELLQHFQRTDLARVAQTSS